MEKERVMYRFNVWKSPPFKGGDGEVAVSITPPTSPCKGEAFTTLTEPYPV